MPTAPSARVLADSVSPRGHRLTTVEATMHRFVLAEFNTHRVFSRNSASSRAIPVERQLRRVADDPAWPLVWPREQRGMQGGDELDGDARADAEQLFADAHRQITDLVDDYLHRHPDTTTRLHKSLINRLLEPFMWHTVIVSATDWDGFVAQRVSSLAQPEIHATAAAIRAAVDGSEPREIDYGQWHTPFADEQPQERALQVSTARCARVSYHTHDGVVDVDADLRLFARLTSADPMHASPLEHQATPAPAALHAPGNFTGWVQHRHLAEQALRDVDHGLGAVVALPYPIDGTATPPR